MPPRGPACRARWTGSASQGAVLTGRSELLGTRGMQSAKTGRIYTIRILTRFLALHPKAPFLSLFLYIYILFFKEKTILRPRLNFREYMSLLVTS